MSAKTHFSTDSDSLIRRGIDQTYGMAYDSALATFEKLSDDPDWAMLRPFYTAATLQSQMMDFESNRWKESFFHSINQAIFLGEQLLETGGPDPWIYFYLGNAYAYKGLFQVRDGSIIPGFINAHKGVGFLEKTMELDPGFADAAIGIGSYQYWSGRFYRYLSWLPFIRDERKQGVSLIENALEKKPFSYWIGLNSLGWIEYDRKNYQRALDLFNRGLSRFPGSRFFLWGVADCLFKMEDYEACIAVYKELLAGIQSASVNNGYNEAECRRKLMKAFFALERYKETLLHCQAILKLVPDPEVEARIKDHRKEALEIRDKALEKIGG
ncbi:tetratricopeptide repeat protein [bacterium]|nr:tetratricopeptide repeat protein [bacterium]